MADTVHERASRLILIVEAHDILRDALRTWVANAFPDSHLRVARTGAEALLACQAEAPDLVLIDDQLPGFDGSQVIAHIRRFSPGAKIVMLTRHARPARRAGAMAAAAAGYVAKTRLTHDLLPLLERLLQDGHGGPRTDPSNPEHGVAPCAQADNPQH